MELNKIIKIRKVEFVIFKERRDCKTEIIRLREPEVEPIIWVAPIALDKMALYVQHCEKEIGWLGRVERQDMNFIIHDVYLFKQEVNATTCEISPEGLSEFIMETLTTNIENGMDIVNNLRLWGHSHVNMGVSPSGQDETQIQSFKEGNPFFVRVIANKAGEMEFCIYDFENAITYKNVKWREWRYNELELVDQIKAEIANKVKVKTYTHINNNYGTYQRGWEYNSINKRWEEPIGEQTHLSVIKAFNDQSDQDIIDLLALRDDDELKIYEEMDIDEIFTNKQLRKISLCNKCSEVENWISKFGLDDDCLSIEPSAILAYAKKKNKILD